MNKKKAGIIAAVVVIVAAAAGGGAWYYLKHNGSGGSGADKVYVESVSNLNSVNSGSQNRYSGVVEAQESWDINKDPEREIKEVFVEEGDMVEEGDSLFEYDMESAKGELAQGALDLEEKQNEITSLQNQISQLTRERSNVPESERFEYTAEIQEKENSIKQTEYDIESKKAEMQKKQESIDNAVVKSKIAGMVKSINKNPESDMMGEKTSYMTVIAVGDFRVKGTVSELNIQTLSQDQPVILRSRVDEEQTWNGTITKIDTQGEESNNNEYIDYSSDSGSTEKATKYPFYVALDSTDGLMMGQHLFIELDEGQMEAKEGIWLFEGYVVKEDEKSYVWAADASSRLEKREVELGEYDENLGEYEILSGLTDEDAIAFPMDGLYEGVTAVTDASEVDYDAPLYNQEGEEGEEPEGEGGEIPGGELIDESGMSNGEGMDGEDGEMMDIDGGSEGEGFSEDVDLEGGSLDGDSLDSIDGINGIDNELDTLDDTGAVG